MKAIISGIYILFDGEEIVYVGQSADIYRRIYEHSSGRSKGLRKVFDTWEYFEVEDKDQRDRMESLLIRVLQPKYNIEIPWHYSENIENRQKEQKVFTIAGFAKNFDKYTNSLSLTDCDAMCGFARGTFARLTIDGEIPKDAFYNNEVGYFSRIKTECIAKIAKNILKNEINSR